MVIELCSFYITRSVVERISRRALAALLQWIRLVAPTQPAVPEWRYFSYATHFSPRKLCLSDYCKTVKQSVFIWPVSIFSPPEAYRSLSLDYNFGTFLPTRGRLHDHVPPSRVQSGIWYTFFYFYSTYELPFRQSVKRDSPIFGRFALSYLNALVHRRKSQLTHNALVEIVNTN